MNVSNELQRSAFVSSPEVTIRLRFSPEIRLESHSSPKIRFQSLQSASTLTRGNASTLTVLALPGDAKIAGYLLKLVILVQIRRTSTEYLATTWLEGLEEYGMGETESEAIADLVVSLGEYRESLERREPSLGHLARMELDHLRRVIEPSPGLSTT